MFSIFKKKPARTDPDLSFLGADMHSHLLPGIDDGLGTIEESVAFIKELQQLGYKKLICTPHIISDIYPNTAAIITEKLDLVKAALMNEGVIIPIDTAAEYMVDPDMEKGVIAGDRLLTFGKNLILIEMSFVAPSPNIEQVIFQLRLKGIQPVVAHPERYGYYHHDFSHYERFIELGCLLQVNLLSLAGYYGKPVKTVAETLIKKRMVDLLGTDMHHMRHMEALKDLASRKDFYKMLEGINIRNRELLL